LFGALGRKLTIRGRLLKQLSFENRILFTGRKAFEFYGAFKIFGDQLHRYRHIETVQPTASLNSKFLHGHVGELVRLTDASLGKVDDLPRDHLSNWIVAVYQTELPQRPFVSVGQHRYLVWPERRVLQKTTDWHFFAPQYLPF